MIEKPIKIFDDCYIEDVEINGIIYRAIRNKNVYESLSFIDDRKFDLPLNYFGLFKKIFEVKSDIRNILVLGGGGFSFPKYCISKYNDLYVDVVEISSELIDISMKYFFLDELYEKYDKERKRLVIYNEDALDFINRENKYDAIFIDLFKDNFPLYKFFQYDVLLKTSELLGDNGVLMINYIIDRDSDNYSKCIQSLEKIYKCVRVITLKSLVESNNVNVLIFCSNKSICFDCIDNSIEYDYKYF